MRSFSPLPSRTVMVRYAKSTSWTRRRTHSIRRRPGAVEELGHQFVNAVQVAQEAEDLVAGEDGGEAFGPFGRG